MLDSASARSIGIRLYQTAIERLATLPGVAGVGLTQNLPFRPGPTGTVSADPDMRGGDASRALVPAAATVVSSRYFPRSA
jgi:hypothetical protein